MPDFYIAGENRRNARAQTEYPDSAAAGYQRWKETQQAQLAASRAQSPQYPGAEVNSVNMTNAARGGDSGIGDAISAQAQRLAYLRGGGGGWLGLLQSGAAQRQLLALRNLGIQQQEVGIRAGHLGVEQGRLGFEAQRYFGGELPMAQARLGLEQQQHAPDISLMNTRNALLAKGDVEGAARMSRIMRGGSAYDVHAVSGMMGTTVGPTEAFAQGVRYLPSMTAPTGAMPQPTMPNNPYFQPSVTSNLR
jgi:hypothetical protein